MTDRRVRLERGGLRLGDELVPLLSGSVHYFRLSRSAWAPALQELRRLGARFVDTCVPWNVHEKARGDFDFGEERLRFDLVAFLKAAESAGLYAILRPGPHIGSELTYFGIPERIVWDPACQARSPGDAPVVLPMLPRSFPVPSYASRAFYDEATLWLAAVATRTAGLQWPDGPLALVQVDNEGAYTFRDGAYDQDYHPDSVEQYRRFLRRKYVSVQRLRVAYESPELTFDDATPPRRLDADHADRLARHVDWAEFQEALLESALYRFSSILRRQGLDRVPFFHNLPPADGATALNAERLEHAVDFVASDVYVKPSEPARVELARRATELAERSEARAVPAFAAEVAAGFPPYRPPLTDPDNAFGALSALAYGIRSVNVYMAVARDRWIGAPIDRWGRARPSAEFWRGLFEALERLRFGELRRQVPVRLVIPRTLRRLVRVLNVTGPLTPAWQVITELGAEAGSLEDSLGFDAPPVIASMAFLRGLESRLERERIPFSITSADLLPRAIAESRWTIVVCPGALEPKDVELLTNAAMSDRAVSVGPFLPERDASFRSGKLKFSAPEHPRAPALLSLSDEAGERAFEETVERLALPRLPAEPDTIHTTLYEDPAGKPRALFVLNASAADHQTRVAAPGAKSAVDALTGECVDPDGDRFALRVQAGSVRFLELLPND